MPSLNKFTVTGLDEHNDWDAPIAVRCTICGKQEERLHPDDVPFLSELIEWAEKHQCATWAVT